MEVLLSRHFRRATQNGGGKRSRMNRAAFFDLDGTLIEKPSLEYRFFRLLRHEGKISASNCIAWLREVVHLAPNGLTYTLEGNKAYLQGVRTTGLRADRAVGGAPLFPGAVERAAQHALHGERIVLVTGTPEFLAEEVGSRLRHELAKENIAAEIHVCATRLEEKDGRWTGKVLGQPMFGEAKAIAVWWFAEKWKLNLSECAAYGDSVHDQWMLASVGKPVAVNPDSGLRMAAQRKHWKIVEWRKEFSGKAKIAKMIPERAR
jgi:HAD superfamily hydrolase (TIGR01490 family)